MRTAPYAELAAVYDFWQEDNSASAWAGYAEKIIGRHCAVRRGDGREGSLLVADLGCGTGSVAIEMARRGYDVIAIDESEEMLSAARAKDTDGLVRFVRQDITRMELYGTVDVMLCFLDTVNHITDVRRLDRFFRMCKRYLNVGGLLILDAATEHYFRDVRGDRTFTDSDSRRAVVWRSRWHAAGGLSTASVTSFSETSRTGLYTRCDTIIRERFHSEELLRSLAAANGLHAAGVVSDFTMKAPGPGSERMFFILQNRRDEQKERLAASMKSGG